MAQEFETKVIMIEKQEIENKLIKIGAKKVGEYFFKRYTYGITDDNNEELEWIRLRTNGEESTLTYKKKNGIKIDETTEIETRVLDFNKMKNILDKCNFTDRFYQQFQKIKYFSKFLEDCY